jgi:hypothetical protein
MRLRPIYLFFAALSIVAAACSSSSSSPAAPTTGTETLSAVVTGADAAANLNNNSSAPLGFPEGTWTGLIATSLKPFALGGPDIGTTHWATPAGTSTVTHSPAAGFANSSAPPASATHWTKSGSNCSLTVTFSKGTFMFVPASSTGSFARLSGTGTYAVTAQATAPLKPGKTACTFAAIDKFAASGAKISFNATAPAVLKPATSSS